MAIRKSVSFVILSGITTRNLLNSGYLSSVAQRLNAEIVVYTTEVFVPATKSYEGVEIRYVTDAKNTFLTRLIYAILRRRGLFAFPTASTKLLTTAPLNRSIKLTLSRLLAYPFPSSKLIFKFFHALLLGYFILRRVTRVERSIRFSSNDIVVSTSPNTIVDFPVMANAFFSEATTISLIKSFDNTSTKGMFPLPSDYYFCWNEFMSWEMQSIFRVPAEKCLITGVPQFDIYSGLVSQSRYLHEIFDIQNEAPIVLYASNHPELGPDDVEIVALIAREFPQMNFVVRVHFMDSPDRWSLVDFQNVFLQFPGTEVSLDSDMRLISEDFLLDLRETIRSCNVVLNTCSTITLDSICLGKDVALLAVDLYDRDFNDSVKRFYKLAHYQQILDLGIFPVLDSMDSLFAYLRRLETGPANTQENLQAAAATLFPRKSLASELFVEAVENIER